jgi:hypothetical protein
MSRASSLELQIRGQRISDEELIVEAQKVVRECGVQNYARAEFVNLLAKLVVGNPAPVLCQLQPKPVQKTSPAWVEAWDLVSSFAASNNLSLTLDTLNTELQNTKQALRLSVKSTRNANDELAELLSSTDTPLPDSEPASDSSAADLPEKVPVVKSTRPKTPAPVEPISPRSLRTTPYRGRKKQIRQ